MTKRSLALAAVVLGAAAAPASAIIGPPASEHLREHAPLRDVRVDAAKGAPAVPAHVRAARRALKRALGPQGHLSVDRVTGAVRWLGRTDGYLTGPDGRAPREVALDWARANLDVLGLTEGDVSRLRLASTYDAPSGVTRLIFQQTSRGIRALDSTLRVNVARDGRILNVGGRPRTGLRVARVTPALTASQAVFAAAAAVGAERPSPALVRATARTALLRLVAMDERRTRLAWRIWFEESSRAAWDVVVDASTGRLIRRSNHVKFAGKGLAWEYYPGAPRGGQPLEVDFTRWLTDPERLRGNFTHTYNDADGTEDFTTDPADPTQDDGDLVIPTEEIRPQSTGDWLYPYTPIPSPLGFCPGAGCAWNHLVNGSWVPNRDQDGTQVFYFVNTFAEHLKRPPIEFDERANFQFENVGDTGKEGDGIYASAMDAAAQAGGRPIPLLWSDNANMLTRPDGESPRMQMFLFEPIQVPGVIDYPFSDVSGGSDGTVIYHEFTHGLSNRLVIDVDGRGALGSIQSGSMGEAWSDFYAMDLLIRQGHLDDTDKPGEVKVGVFVDGGQDLVRTEAIDCRPGDPKEACPRKRGVDQDGGGYTYEEFGRIVPGGAEVHADGEIWAQTLMDLRRLFVADHGAIKGSDRAELYVTRGMELSIDEPSFIDMRNAILQADLVAGRKDHTRIWQTFAARGMGASASAVDGSDTAPVAAFDLPAGLPAIDRAAPHLTIDSPGEGGVVRIEKAVVSGTATDDSGATALTVNGIPAAVSSSSTWSTTLKLPAGRHTIKVTARDIEDRASTATRTLFVDARRPKLGRVKVRRSGRRWLITGTTRDDVAAASVRVGTKRVPTGRGGKFFVALRRGNAKKVSAVVRDRAGRTSKRKSIRLR